MAEETTQQKITRRTFRGVVVSSKMKDTVVVEVERYVKIPKYQKYTLRAKKYLAYDSGNMHAEGDQVTIRETRPRSKRVHFEII